MKILKNKLVLGLSLIIVLVLTIFSYSKIREYNVLKDVFVFKNEISEKIPHIFSAIEIFQYPGGNWYGKRKKQNKETNRHRG